MEMITKKLIERSGQGSFNTTDTGNDKKGISLGDNNQKNSNGDNCLSLIHI